MKKIISFILLVSVMLMTVILPVSAASGALSSTATLSGDKTIFTVNLSLKNNPGVIAITAEAEYDSKVLKLKSSENGVIFPSVERGPLESNPYKLIWMDATAPENIKTNGILATFTFEVLKDAPLGESTIKFNITEAVNVDLEDNIKFTGCSVKINVNDNVDTNNSQNTSSNIDSVNSNVGGFEVIEVEKPEVNADDSDTSSQQTEPDAMIDETSSDEAETENIIGNTDDYYEDQDSKDNDDDSDKGKNSSRTLMTVLTIAVILILGGAVAFVAVYVRKKSANK